MDGIFESSCRSFVHCSICPSFVSIILSPGEWIDFLFVMAVYMPSIWTQQTRVIKNAELFRKTQLWRHYWGSIYMAITDCWAWYVHGLLCLDYYWPYSAVFIVCSQRALCWLFCSCSRVKIPNESYWSGICCNWFEVDVWCLHGITVLVGV